MNNIYTLTSLHNLIIKATHESLACPEPEALEAFCAVMRDEAEGLQLGAQMLAARIQSPNAREALLALTMLDRCMSRCDSRFHSEIGKFRFLNEMIKLVSPKYFADRTAPEVRTRVLQLLHAWSIEYPKETKFKVAYEMLKNQGVVKETPPPLPPEDGASCTRARPKSAVFEDEEKTKLLQKLLQSKKPEDLQHANKLIKTMVREEERRNEANSRCAQEVSAALDSAGLLRDLLEHSSDISPDEEQLIHEIQSSCMRLRPMLQQLAASETHTENLEDILRASDFIDEVFEKYNAFVAKKKEFSESDPPEKTVSNSEALLDFAGAVIDDGSGSTKNGSNKKKSIDELGDIFSTEALSNIVEPLKPVNLMSAGDGDIQLVEKSNKSEGWQELDSLGKELLQQSLPDHIKKSDGFNSKTTKKIPMNSLEKNSPKHETRVNDDSAMLDLDFFTKKLESAKLTPQVIKMAASRDDDLMVDISVDVSSNISTMKNENNDKVASKINDETVEKILDLGLPVQNNSECDKIGTPVENKEISVAVKESQKNKASDVKPLTDINMTLDSVKPSKVPPLTAFEEENGVTVVLHFCKDKPRADVNVIVVSTTSKNTSPIEDYRFQSVVPKGCKVRLLPASGTSLPAYNPFLPPPALTQVMLLGRPPTLPPVNLKFVITYTCDGEMCSEIGEVPQLPLDEI